MSRSRSSGDAGTFAFLIVVGGSIALYQWTADLLDHKPMQGILVLLGAVFVIVMLAIGIRKLYKLQAARDREISSTYGLSGSQFEHYVARLMKRDGFSRVRVSGGSGDLGADIVAYTPEGDKIVVQCKHLSSSLSSPDVQKFNGTVWDIHGADIALLVTSSWPTGPAARLAAALNITLVHHSQLAIWAHDRIVPIDGWKYGPKHWWKRFSLNSWWIPTQRWALWRLKSLAKGRQGVKDLELTGQSADILGLTIHIVGGAVWLAFLTMRLIVLILSSLFGVLSSSTAKRS